MIARSDALCQLAQVIAAQQIAQLGLADQDDLQQLLRFGLEIGEQSNLFKYFDTEILRLIDNQHHAPARAVRPQQITV